jgi:hypothetical protein
MEATMPRIPLVLAVPLVLAACAGSNWMTSGPPTMGFFVTSANPGKGADFGGLAGADAYCQMLAGNGGAGSKIWHAYLSTTGSNGVNARDRIGRGPWYNAKGEMIAGSVDELHGTNGIRKQTALTERGELVPGRGDPVNMHDILTGSGPDGRAMTTADDTTCANWTSSGKGSAIVGHHDRMGLRDDEASRSWNSSHPTRGCGMEALKSTGGDGRLYCFATN